MVRGEIGKGEVPERDAREELADDFRTFFLDAIEQQVKSNAEFNETGRQIAGRWYKIDNGFIKIHLVPPAPDQVFGESFLSPEVAVEDVFESNPQLWVLLPLPQGRDEVESDLINVVTEAEEMIAHIRLPRTNVAETFTIRDDFLGFRLPLAEVELTPEDLLKPEPDDDEQIATANMWRRLLKKYDLRTIGSSGKPASSQDNAA